MPAPEPRSALVERAEKAWAELALRLNLTGEHCGWFKDWFATLERETEARVWEKAAKLAGDAIETGEGVDAGRIWRNGMALTLGRAFRNLAVLARKEPAEQTP